MFYLPNVGREGLRMFTNFKMAAKISKTGLNHLSNLNLNSRLLIPQLLVM